MVHSDLLVILVAALVAVFCGGFLAARLRLPPIIGYLLAGVAIGPFTPGFSTNPNIAAELAEVGVILLMFGVGIHFSLRDLMAVRAIALPGAVGQIAVATGLGAGLALTDMAEPGERGSASLLHRAVCPVQSCHDGRHAAARPAPAGCAPGGAQRRALLLPA